MLVVAPIYILYRRARVSIAPLRKRCALYTHIIVLAILVAALAGVKSMARSERLSVIFLLDISKSVDQGNIDAAKAVIAKMSEKMALNDSAALLVFGGQASMELGYSSKEDFKIGGVTTSVISRDFTDISEAVRLAIASFPQDAQKRIVLFSDGNQNSGSALRAAMQAKSAGVDLQTVVLKNTNREDLILKRLITPEIVAKDNVFDIRFTVESTYDTRADIEILVDGRVAKGGLIEDQEIKKGENFLTKRLALKEPGLHNVRVRVTDRVKAAASKTDDIINNNEYSSLVRVLGESSKVLYIEGGTPPTAAAAAAPEGGGSPPAPPSPQKWEPEKYLRDALVKSGLDVDVRTPEGIPQEMSEYEQYDAVIISDTAARCFEANNVMEKIRSYVKDMGGGLIMVGGENSFALGNYTNTPIEEALPVNCDMREQYDRGSIAIAIVIDRSGSTAASAGGGKTKLDLAAEGAIATLKNLKDRDHLGVLFVDTATLWLPPIKPISGGRQEIIGNLRGAKSGGGGILIRTGLQEAYLALSRTNANIKHIILFADASDCEEQEGADIIAKEGREKWKITLTTIGMGDAQSVHAPFLKHLADVGKGRFHLVTDVNNLPSLFVKDALIATKSYLVEKEFQPKVVNEMDPALKGILEASLSVPTLKGYVGVTKKDAASLTLTPPDTKDPILARWQYGLGKSAAFTSDCKNRWSPGWIEDPTGFYQKFWGQLVKSTMRSPFPTYYSNRMVFDRQAGAIVVEALEDGQPVNYLDLKAKVVLPDGSDVDVPLAQHGPGMYRGEFNGEQIGAYFAVIVNDKTGQPIGKIQHTIPYSPEYMTTREDAHLMQSLASAAGGSYYDSLDAAGAANIFAHDNLERKSYREIWRQLMLAAMVLLLIEVAIRRLVLPEFRKRKPRARAADEPVLQNLLRRKHERLKEEKNAASRADFLRSQGAKEQPVWNIPRPGKPASVPPAAEPGKGAPATPSAPAPEDTFDRLLRAKKSKKGK
jgi:uncharacterized membrane protein